MRRGLAPAPAAIALLALLVGATASPESARAGTEEFSSFSIIRQEEDDESLLDHVLTEPPRAWRDAWERAPMALRTSQGCLTSGQWIVRTELRTFAKLGERARLELDFNDDASDRATSQYFDLWFRFPTRWGTLGGMFRPFFDKSRQDFAAGWRLGADTTGVRVDAVIGIEDTFNNLWAFRQTRVGNASEPYERHPFEPALAVSWRGERSRGEIGGRYLTPSAKRLVVDPSLGTDRLGTLWGTDAWVTTEWDVAGLGWSLAGRAKQAMSRWDAEQPAGQDGDDWRRQWSLEAGVRRAWSERWSTELRAIYQDRAQITSPPFAPGRLDALDRMVQLEVQWRPGENLGARVGAMHDRVGVGTTYAQPRLLFGSYGSRTERRAYVGLWARFGNVTVSGVEGIELDDEPYEVWLVHDKGFLSLQATF